MLEVSTRTAATEEAPLAERGRRLLLPEEALAAALLASRRRSVAASARAALSSAASLFALLLRSSRRARSRSLSSTEATSLSWTCRRYCTVSCAARNRRRRETWEGGAGVEKKGKERKGKNADEAFDLLGTGKKPFPLRLPLSRSPSLFFLYL
jgi:hypothetical protein